ncbi:MAG: hypothetical protein MK101_12735 [Phycisphaerales bacterium]|nr:hypothetical protein [Phycisphaerales bacterium]
MPPIVACESGLSLPTLTVKGNYNTKEASPKSGDGLATALKRRKHPTLTANAYGSNRGGAAGRTGEVRHSLQTLTSSDAKGGAGHASSGGPLNPEWCAHFMGWPVGWTGLEPLAMDRFQLWLRLHGVCCMTG